MKIGLAQIQSKVGEIDYNLKLHLNYLQKADEFGADLVCFPELSLLGYDPSLAKENISNTLSDIWNSFQLFSNRTGMIACIGMPSPGKERPRISMFVISPHESIKIYSKQKLHPDEMPYFEPGDMDLILEWGNHKIAPAICYESLLEDNAKQAKEKGATIYLASVAKSKSGMNKAVMYFPEMAAQMGLNVGVVNALGGNSEFTCVGQSAIWNMEGSTLGGLDSEKEGLLIWDVKSGSVSKIQ